MTTATAANVDAGEIAKFDAIAQRWWDPAGEFAPLHRLNPLRAGYVAGRVALDGARVAEGLDVRYRCVDVASLIGAEHDRYDAVACMELIEHVPDPAALLASLAALVRPGGTVFVSTLNRTARSFGLAIVAAEYLLGIVPRGTHDYARFIRPSELARAARAVGLELTDLTGIEPVLPGRGFRLGPDVSVNYVATFERPVGRAS